jgi:predicted ABC-type ATPase
MKEMSNKKAMMIVFAGNNGSGKSTIRNLIIDRIGTSVNIDPDAIARRINSSNPETVQVSAGKEAIRLARDCIKLNRDFSIETTLSGVYAVRLIQEAKKEHYEVIMFYVGLGDPRLNIARVAGRVRNGGHHIPSSDILHRHQSSLQNLLLHLDLINQLIIIDNSSIQGRTVLEADNGKLIYQDYELPDWAEPIKTRYLS